jgi:hypothetical protein
VKNLLRNYPKRLVLVNFPGTIARTSMMNRDGLNADDAYQDAIQEIFGPEGFQRFYDNKDLHNAPATQVVMYLASRPELAKNLRNYCEICNIHDDFELVDPIPILVKEFVDLYTSYLKLTIGTICFDKQIWPEIHTGFGEFQNQLKRSNIDLGIISPFPEGFIREVFNFYHLGQPLICVGPNDGFDPNFSWHASDPDWIDIAINEWIEINPELTVSYALKNTVYIGNDITIDGKLANSKGIPFWFFSQNVNFDLLESQRIFSNYGQLVNAVKEGKLFKKMEWILSIAYNLFFKLKKLFKK